MEIRFNEPAPVSPGEVLRDDILAGTGITQDTLAAAMGVSRFTVNQIINGRRAVTADTALRLARVLSTTPDLWLNLQRDVDLWRARRARAAEIEGLSVLRKAPAEFVTLDDLVAGQSE
jgi:antitoxin HigA-1